MLPSLQPDGNDTYSLQHAFNPTLTVKTTGTLDQNITWDQTISGLSIGGADVNMTAKSIDADTGADTNLTITYTARTLR